MIKIFKIDLTNSKERKRNRGWATEEDVNKFLKTVYTCGLLQSSSNDTLIITVSYDGFKSDED